MHLKFYATNVEWTNANTLNIQFHFVFQNDSLEYFANTTSERHCENNTEMECNSLQKTSFPTAFDLNVNIRFILHDRMEWKLTLQSSNHSFCIEWRVCCEISATLSATFLWNKRANDFKLSRDSTRYWLKNESVKV